jgi:hypothetical protein
MADTDLKIPAELKDFTPKEKKLFELLVKRDETGKLARMLQGAVKVMKDPDNPVRFAQAANTIRGIAEELLKLEEGIGDSAQSYVELKDIGDLRKRFELILEKASAKIDNADDKSETLDQAKNKFDQLIKVLSFGSKSRKRRLFGLLGADKDLKIVAEPVQNAAKKLTDIYRYFTDVLHAHRENEPEFDGNWILFQDFLILVTSDFFEIAAEIQPFLEEETIKHD